MLLFKKNIISTYSDRNSLYLDEILKQKVKEDWKKKQVSILQELKIIKQDKTSIKRQWVCSRYGGIHSFNLLFFFFY